MGIDFGFLIIFFKLVTKKKTFYFSFFLIVIWINLVKTMILFFLYVLVAIFLELVNLNRKLNLMGI
jgi:hypothetical protein